MRKIRSLVKYNLYLLQVVILIVITEIMFTLNTLSFQIKLGIAFYYNKNLSSFTSTNNFMLYDFDLIAVSELRI